MFCRICGTKIPDDSRFCTKCGASVIPAKSEKDNHIVITATVTANVTSPKIHSKSHIFSNFIHNQKNLFFVNCKRFLSHWYTTHGRSTRMEFWSFYFLLMLIGQMLALFIFEVKDLWFIIWIFMLLALVQFAALYTLMVRRLHDIGKGCMWSVIYAISNWFVNRIMITPWGSTSYAIIPILLMGYVLFLMVKPSVGDNKYGTQYPEMVKELSENEQNC